MITMCLLACLWAQIAKTPFNYTITAQTLLAKCDDYRFQWLILQFPALGKKMSYRKHVHHNPSSKYASRCWAKREWLHDLCDNWNHFTSHLRKLVLRCLTGSLMTISSKLNYRVRLNVNMDIADSISFYFNFGKGHYFVLRLKQHFFDKARFFFKRIV